jgi:hypothetical protein
MLLSGRGTCVRPSTDDTIRPDNIRDLRWSVRIVCNTYPAIPFLFLLALFSLW